MRSLLLPADAATALADLGFSAAEIARLNRPISALNLETTQRRRVSHRVRKRPCLRIRPASRSTRLLLVAARRAGAHVRMATVVSSVELPAGPTDTRALGGAHRFAPQAADAEPIEARLVVGADGPASVVARAARVYAKSPFLSKSGITFHRRDPAAAPPTEPMEGRFVFGRDWYVGIAPVPADRVNVGMVVPPKWLRRPRRPRT